jgi:hypothetical protein
MNIHRAGVVLAGLVLAVAIVGLPSPAQAGVIIHDAAYPPGPTATGVIIHDATDVPPVTWAIGPDI